ncbi:hypothetical protein ACFL3V_05420 [Nanoarchaeota archaeon]
MQEIKFPCGSRGAAGFCPDLCQFGKFCKVVEQKQEQPRGLVEEKEQDTESDETPSEDAKVEMYY